MDDRFRVAISGAFQTAEGNPLFPMFDLTPLVDDIDIDFEYVPGVNNHMTADSLENFDALILLLETFDKDSIPRSGRLALVTRFGVGYDTVDIDACTAAGIAVGITPDGVRRPVAVAVLTFVLALSGKLLAKDALVRGGPETFAQRSDHMGIGLIGKTLGSIGLGNIGSEVFHLCAPLGMRFIAHDPYVSISAANAINVDLTDLDTVLRESDFLTINAPLSIETHHLINAARLQLMKRSAFLINTSRGQIVDQNALVDALTTGVIAGAGLDVYETEPPDLNDHLLALNNVILTPHALCWTDQCFASMGAQDLEHVFSIKRGKLPSALVDPNVIYNSNFKQKLDRCRSNFPID